METMTAQAEALALADSMHIPLHFCHREACRLPEWQGGGWPGVLARLQRKAQQQAQPAAPTMGNVALKKFVGRVARHDS